MSMGCTDHTSYAVGAFTALVKFSSVGVFRVLDKFVQFN